MRTKSIQYFLEVAEEMSFTKAAQKLYISQQALSGHVARLEEEYGVVLFERKPSLRLTEEGKRMVFYGRQILESEKNLRQAFADIHANCRGSLSVGMSRLRGSVMFPPLYAEYHKDYPNIAVELISDNTSQLNNLLLAGNVDVYLGVDVAPDPFEARIPIATERMGCILHLDLLRQYYPDSWEEKAAHLKKSAYLEDLIDLPLIGLRRGARLRSSVDRLLKAGHEVNYALECDQTVISYDMAVSGVGAALLSPITFYPHIEELKNNPELLAFPLHDQQLENAVYLVYRSDIPQPQYVMDFILKAMDSLPGYAEAVKAALTQGR